MKSRITISATVAALSFAAGAINAHAACTPIAGFATLIPQTPPTCTIAGTVQGPFYLGALGIPNTCFTVTLKNLIGGSLGSGFAGVTSEMAVSPLAGATQSPFILAEPGVFQFTNELSIQESRRLFTARSALTLLGGTIFTADAGVATGPASVEELLITGGTGAHVNAKGSIYLNGTVIGGSAPFAGKICTP